MTRLFSMAAAALAAIFFMGCGGSGDPGDDRIPRNMGAIEFHVVGGATDDLLANIAIRDVFDPSKTHLIECYAKDHLLDGQLFCDELLILPPGVYEIIVQPTDPLCETEAHHIKVAVKAGKVEHYEIDILCADPTGGLDVLVRQFNAPRIEDIEFTFPDGRKANKFMCTDGPNPVEITITVSDLDDPTCADLDPVGEWAVDDTGLILYGAAQDENDLCKYSILVDTANSTPGDYTVMFTVKEKDEPFLEASITFPVFILDNCYPEEPND